MNSSTTSRLETALYVVATPIGNLEDLSPRAARVLCNVSTIAAEDTRHTGLLLRQLQREPGQSLFSANAHNEHDAANRLIGDLAADKSCALVSDAGTPAISDPGARIVSRVRSAGYRVIPIPGPSAITALLSVAGIDAGHFGSDAGEFIFVGFLPTRSQARADKLRQLTRQSASVVLLEAPHRIAQTLASINQAFGSERSIVIGRELTKQFEQIVCLPAGQTEQWLKADPNHRRGEFVLAIAPAPSIGKAEKASDSIAADTIVTVDSTLEELLGKLLARLPASQAAKLAQELTGLPRKQIYDVAMTINQGQRNT